jgi:hypothetical protein
MPERAYKLALLGLTQKEAAPILGIKISTFEQWIRDRDEFREQWLKGGAEADANVAHSLYQSAVGYKCKDTYFALYKGQIYSKEYKRQYPPNVNAAMFWLNNRTRRNENDWFNLRKANVKVEDSVNKNSLDDSILEGFSDEELEVIGGIITKHRKDKEKKKKDDAEKVQLN